MSQQGPHFSPHSTAKTNNKSTNLGKNDIYWYKLRVYSEKTRLKKLMIMIMNKSHETTVFGGRQNLTFAMKLGQKSDGRLQI